MDVETRDATRRNHTATHLLHAALRQVLGPHVKQAGSLVAPDRLRFDFAHFSGDDAGRGRARSSAIVNEHVLANIAGDDRGEEPPRTAIAGGAMALFGEKYGDTVRVVSVPGVSQELCGGTHVRATGDIGLFAVDVRGRRRRRRAPHRGGDRAASRCASSSASRARSLAGSAALINATPGQLPNAWRRSSGRSKRLTRELQQAQDAGRARRRRRRPTAAESVQVAGVTLVARQVDGLDKDGLRALVDRHRDQIKSGVVVLAAPADGKVLIVAGVTPDLVKRIPAGQVVKQLAPIVGGGGGGRPDFAEAGGKDPSKIAELLAASRAVVEKLVGS